jgi:regulator of replication initiation timing
MFNREKIAKDIEEFQLNRQVEKIGKEVSELHQLINSMHEYNYQLREDNKKLESRVKNLEEKKDEVYQRTQQWVEKRLENIASGYVECSKCGVVVQKYKAKTEPRLKKPNNPWGQILDRNVYETVYYCNHCKRSSKK